MILVRDIQRATAEHYGLAFGVMSEPDAIGNRLRTKAHPRQMAMLLARRMTKSEYTKIGRIFGRDHSTIIMGCRSARRRCLADRKNIVALCAIRARVLAL